MFTVFQNNLCILGTYSFLIPMRETRARARHVTLLSTIRSKLRLAPLCSRRACLVENLSKQEIARSHKGPDLDYREGGPVILCLILQSFL